MKKLFSLFVLCAGLVLSGCAQTQLAAYTVKKLPFPNEAPKSEGRYKIGSSYKIFGIEYQPKEQFDLVEQGIASWYGDPFHGRKTANGEVYSKFELTAAHRTLQLPSLIRVTNLDNGRQLVLRVNDRGPFKRGRILDVSERGAELLGFKQQGTARIKLEVLEDESRILAEAAKRGIQTDGVEVAYNQTGQLPQEFQRFAPYDMKHRNDVGSVRLASAQATTVPQRLVQNAAVEAVSSQQLPSPDITARAQRLQDVPMDEPRTNMTQQQSPQVEESGVKQVAPVPTGIYVQAGAFSDIRNARQLSMQLADISRSFVEPVQLSGRNLYRVRLGPIKTVDSADMVLSRVIDRGHKSAMIIVD